MDKDEIKESVKGKNLPLILEKDQLIVQKEAGNVFNDFNEGEITFPPTYKYDLFSEDFDTSEKCRAPAWTDRVLWRRRKLMQDNGLYDWNEGQLIHYGRAELKQSDHRPVIAIIAIEVGKIDVTQRQKVFYDVIRDLGPFDCTIVIQADSSTLDDEDAPSIYDEDVTTTIISELGLIGEVTLVRFVGETMWVTFRDGQSALTAVQKNSVHIKGIEFHFKLKTENWLGQVEREIALCTTNTVQLCTSSPVGDYNSLGIPKMPPNRPKSPPGRPQPPSRPPLPTTPKHAPRAGVISVIPNTSAASQGEQRFVNSPQMSPQRPAPPIPGNTKQSSTSTSARSSISSGSSPEQPPIKSLSIKDEDTGAIYEEINDDIVRHTKYSQLL